MDSPKVGYTLERNERPIAVQLETAPYHLQAGKAVQVFQG